MEFGGFFFFALVNEAIECFLINVSFFLINLSIANKRNLLATRIRIFNAKNVKYLGIIKVKIH